MIFKSDCLWHALERYGDSLYWMGMVFKNLLKTIKIYINKLEKVVELSTTLFNFIA
ncbi:hypothetical protein psyc5s11_03420 [Clostridium gelidum]|uniref:Uncharacterized protein n=1 Tax=Clostridium gelidum TaxID=704125 RepID=A0ABM7SZD3_9CLOT|nr:hypothetical protein psyc5s11_03420 [Clostridium gelidum]